MEVRHRVTTPTADNADNVGGEERVERADDGAQPPARPTRAPRTKHVRPAALAMGQRIKAARKARRLSQQALATAVHITRPYLSEIECGYHPAPARELLRAIAALLGTPLDTLLDGTEAAPPSPPAGFGDQLGMVFDAKPLILPIMYIGRANAGEGGGHIAQGEVAAMPVQFLAGRSHEQVGIARVVGHCLHPLVDEGDWLLVDRLASPQAGKLVLVKVKATEELICKFWWPAETSGASTTEGANGRVWLMPHPESGVGQPVLWQDDEMDFLGVVFLPLAPKDLPTLVLSDPRLHLLGGPPPVPALPPALPPTPPSEDGQAGSIDPADADAAGG